jgi:hypothetical protein
VAVYWELAHVLEPAGVVVNSVGDILAAYETDRITWHCTGINSQSSFSKLFPLSKIEEQLLAQKGI